MKKWLLAGLLCLFGQAAHADWCDQYKGQWKSTFTMTTEKYAVLSSTPIVVFDFKVTSRTTATDSYIVFFNTATFSITTPTAVWINTSNTMNSDSNGDHWCMPFSRGLTYSKSGDAMVNILYAPLR